MSYTTAPEDGPSWMNRLPRISSQSRSQARTMSDTDIDELKLPEMPPGTLPHHFLRRVREQDPSSRQGSRASSLANRNRKKKKWDDGIGPGGPVSQSAIFPQRRSQSEQTSTTLHESQSPQERPSSSGTLPPSRRASGKERDVEKEAGEHEAREGETPSPDQPDREGLEVYDEGDHIIIEDDQGEVLVVGDAPEDGRELPLEHLKEKIKDEPAPTSSGWTYDAIKKKIGNWRDEEIQKRKDKQWGERKHEPARAYQFGNTIIVEDEDGEVVKKYELPTQKPDGSSGGGGGDIMATSLKYMGMGGLVKNQQKEKEKEAGSSKDGGEAEAWKAAAKGSMPNWVNFGRTGESAAERERKKSVVEEAAAQDDKQIRFTISGVNQRMTKEDFIHEMQKLDKGTRREVVDQSTASNRVKTLAKQDPVPGAAASSSPSRAAGAKHLTASKPAIRLDVQDDEEESGSSSSARPRPGRAPRRKSPSLSPEVSPGRSPSDDDDELDPETAVERRRRLAVLDSVEGDDEHDETNETPAERRRREAALGVSRGAHDSDSDDDDTPRVPPARRGIRFAEPERGRK